MVKNNITYFFSEIEYYGPKKKFGLLTLDNLKNKTRLLIWDTKNIVYIVLHISLILYEIKDPKVGSKKRVREHLQ